MNVFGLHSAFIAAALLSTSVANAVDELIPPAKLVVDASPVIASATEVVEATEIVTNEAEAVAEAVAETVAESAVTESELVTSPPSKEEISKLPESEIPVLTGAKQTKRAEGGNLSRLMITLGVLTVVVGGAFFALRRWASRSGSDTKSPKIKIITQHSLGPKKSLAIIHVAGESILVGITDHNISMLKTLSLIDDEVPDSVPATFGNAMAEFDDDDEIDALGPAEHDDFAMQDLDEIRDRVSRRLEVR